MLKDYIEKHRLVRINQTDFSEVLPDDPIGFCRVIGTMGMWIRQVGWWERIEIARQSESLGGGGPRDPSDARYMWSEIYYMSRTFEKGTTADAVIEYVAETQQKYPERDMRPAFDLTAEA